MVTKSGQMAKRTKIKQLSSEQKQHPYVEYEGTKTWKIINKAIEDLIENDDIKEMTLRCYIVGYLCKKLHKANLIPDFE